MADAGASDPGLFRVLISDGLVSREQLAPLLDRLPAEQIVRAAARGGEGFDSTRWPLARDAALASWIAARDPEPAVAAALAELAAARGDPTRLRQLARHANARLIAAYGGDAAMFVQIWRDPSAAELAVFTAPRMRADAARTVADLCNAHHEAADGLYAYHVHRGLPGPAAEAAARLAAAALQSGRITAGELLAAALALLPGAV